MSNVRFYTIFSFFIIVVSFSCTWEQLEPKIDCSLSPVEISLIESINSECNASNGSFTVLATGGEPPFQITSELGARENGIYKNVSAGSYTVEAKDVKGCSATLLVEIENIEGVNLDNVFVTDAGCGTSLGTIQVVASGGLEPYTYRLNNSNEQSDNIFDNLNRGTYQVSVTDQNGCSVKKDLQVNSGVSYTESVKSIIETSCAISNCHNGSVSPDLRTFSTIKSRAVSIKSRTANGSMPRGSTLSASQIELIACWVDDGALQN